MKISLFSFSLIFLAVATLVTACGSATGGVGSGADRNSAYLFSFPTAFQPTKPTGVSGATQLVIGTFTDDQYPDIILLTETTGMVIYKNEDGEGFSTGVTVQSAFTNTATGAALSDGSAFATTDQIDGTLRLWNVSDGVISQATSFSHSGGVVSSLAIADDKNLFGVVNPGTSYMTRILASDFDASTAAGDFSSIQAKVLTADLNVDSFEDFLVISKVSTAAKVYRGRTGAVPELYGSAFWNRTSTSTVDDFAVVNLAGSATKKDIALLTDDGLEVFENGSSGSTMLFTSSTVTNGAQITGSLLVAADFADYGDSENDLYVTGTGAGKLFRHVGDLLFDNITENAFPPSTTGTSPVGVYSVDLNGDSYPDLVEVSSSATIRVYINNGKDLSDD